MNKIERLSPRPGSDGDSEPGLSARRLDDQPRRRSPTRPPLSAAPALDKAPDPAARVGGDEPANQAAQKPLRPRRRWSKLTARVLAVNLLGLAFLAGGVLYLSQYEDQLLRAELENMQTEAAIFAGALAESAVIFTGNEQRQLDPDQARRMARRLYETTESRTRLFALDGHLLVDSRQLAGPGGIIEIEPLPPPVESSLWRSLFDKAYRRLTALLPNPQIHPVYVEGTEQDAFDYAPVLSALAGSEGSQIWSINERRLILGVAVPIQHLQAVLGAVFITRDDRAIDRTVQSVREAILKVSALAVGVTVLMSLYLAGSITRPIRRLAAAADIVRTGQGRSLTLPDFTGRRDEIGDLSGALRDMTSAMWARMDAIERFAADVAHEIKNPLTSLRSAVETLSRVKDAEKRDRLLAIIQQDVDRLDRLISDISDASRLDAELSRATGERVDVGEMLVMLEGLYRSTQDPETARLVFSTSGRRTLVVQGLEGRLVQVLRNLISNAISFSPPGGKIAIHAEPRGQLVAITVTDEGPGLPHGAEGRIFERFYSERPSGEPFGRHSGLGLSISRQIIEAHGGTIEAANRRDRSGAIFTIEIPAIRAQNKTAD